MSIARHVRPGEPTVEQSAPPVEVDTAYAGAMRFWRWRRLSELSQVEGVDLYTRQMLYVVIWLVNAVVLYAAAVSDDVGAMDAVAAVGGSVAITLLGTKMMSVVAAQYPAPRPLPWRWLMPLIVLSTVFLATVVRSADGRLSSLLVTVVALNVAWGLGGLPDNRLGALITAYCGVLYGLDGQTVFSTVVGVIYGAALVASVRAALWLYAMVTELASARRAQARLAVAEERLRFSRDVHDVLGRRLSAIAVQAELAATFAKRGDERAVAGMLEVREVAHETLREARELARGYRRTDLATELDGARSLLGSAGIDVGLEVDTVPRAWHEPAGWVVRESVTNVLRHSDASEVTISYADGELRVVNDGVDDSGAQAEGLSDESGLRGLRERLEPLGATLTIESGHDRWAVVALLPGSGPLSTASAKVGS